MPAPKTTFRYKERYSRSWWHFINVTVKDACCFHGETVPCQFSDRFRQSGRQEGREGCFLFLPYFFLEQNLQNCAMKDEIINIPGFGHIALWKALCPATEAKRQPQVVCKQWRWQCSNKTLLKETDNVLQLAENSVCLVSHLTSSLSSSKQFFRALSHPLGFPMCLLLCPLPLSSDCSSS